MADHYVVGLVEHETIVFLARRVELAGIGIIVTDRERGGIFLLYRSDIRWDDCGRTCSNLSVDGSDEEDSVIVRGDSDKFYVGSDAFSGLGVCECIVWRGLSACGYVGISDVWTERWMVGVVLVYSEYNLEYETSGWWDTGIAGDMCRRVTDVVEEGDACVRLCTIIVEDGWGCVFVEDGGLVRVGWGVLRMMWGFGGEGIMKW
ncbi:hypothetical protein Tco_0511063 [Tanacetum coccineum]